MKKSKPLRKQSTVHRAFLLTKYAIQRSLRFPLAFAYVCRLCFGLLLTAIAILLWVVLLASFSRGESGLPDGILKTFSLICFTISTCFMDYIWFKAIVKIVETPHGHFLNPLPPEPNEILPEKSVLVRASMPTNSGYKDILLRAANGTAETNPETLLRADTNEISN